MQPNLQFTRHGNSWSNSPATRTLECLPKPGVRSPDPPRVHCSDNGCVVWAWSCLWGSRQSFLRGACFARIGQLHRMFASSYLVLNCYAFSQQWELQWYDGFQRQVLFILLQKCVKYCSFWRFDIKHARWPFDSHGFLSLFIWCIHLTPCFARDLLLLFILIYKSVSWRFIHLL